MHIEEIFERRTKKEVPSKKSDGEKGILTLKPETRK